MTFETYQQRAAELGIHRGAFEARGRFREELPGVVPHDEKPKVLHRVSRKVVPPPVQEDLSRFAKGKFDWREGLGSGGPRNFIEATKAFYVVLYKRTTPDLLARALGVHRSGVHNAIRGSRMGRAIRERLLPLLTEEERTALPAMAQ